MTIRLCLLCFCCALLFSIPVAATPGYSHKLDVQLRLDNRSNRAHREQYRLRYYPSVTFSENSAWSLNSFVVSGDDFSSSHNTFGNDNTDRIYVRRLYVRHTGDYGKTEAGVIPTYKGRVSSSGLSKDGWIEGLRHVRHLPNDSALELVVGQLHNTNPANALSTPDDLDYFELEYSARMGQAKSFEISAERMTNGNFLRGEYRWRFRNDATVFVELIKRLDKDETKTVMGVSGQWQMGNYPLEYFAHYSYVSEGFGPRAELTEDFLGTGHGMSAELEGELWSDWQLDWFVRLDVVDSVSRVLTGVKFPLHYP